MSLPACCAASMSRSHASFLLPAAVPRSMVYVYNAAHSNPVSPLSVRITQFTCDSPPTHTLPDTANGLTGVRASPLRSPSLPSPSPRPRLPPTMARSRAMVVSHRDGAAGPISTCSGPRETDRCNRCFKYGFDRSCFGVGMVKHSLSLNIPFKAK